MSHVRYVVPNHLQLNYSLSNLFRRRTKNHQRCTLWALFEGNPLVTGGFPAQKVSNVGSVPYHDFIMKILMLVFASVCHCNTIQYKHDISWCKPTTNWKTRCDFDLRIATPGPACVTVWGQWHYYENKAIEERTISLVSLQQGQQRTLIIRLNFEITKGTPYLTLMGKVCGLHC